jgi:hypothetical protein
LPNDLFGFLFLAGLGKPKFAADNAGTAGSLSGVAPGAVAGHKSPVVGAAGPAENLTRVIVVSSTPAAGPTPGPLSVAAGRSRAGTSIDPIPTTENSALLLDSALWGMGRAPVHTNAGNHAQGQPAGMPRAAAPVGGAMSGVATGPSGGTGASPSPAAPATGGTAPGGADPSSAIAFSAMLASGTGGAGAAPSGLSPAMSPSASPSASSSASTGPSTITWNGKPWYLLGANYPWNQLGYDLGSSRSNLPQQASDFQTMSSEGARVTRWWVFARTQANPVFNADGTVAGLTSTFLSDVSQALANAASANIYIIFTVIDATAWGPVQNGIGGHSAMVTNTTVQQSYLNNALTPFVKAVASDPNANRVLAYDIVNEPEAQIKGLGGGSNLSLSSVQSFVQACAAVIHANGSAYATVGSETPTWVTDWKNCNLDFYSLHYYPSDDSHGKPGSGLPTYSSLGLDKACIVGEYQTADANYTIGSTTIQSAQWYLDTTYNDGYAGSLAWAYTTGNPAIIDWPDFQPVFTNWSQTHSGIIGPS